MKMKQMTAILGSPKANGNLAKMLDLAINKAKSCGYEVNFVSLYEKNISYCKSCMECRRTGICIIKDDIQEIKKFIKESDIIVLASPTYFANVSAPVKAMFDRLAGTIMKEGTGNIPKPGLRKEQKYILMTTCSTPFLLHILAGQSTGCIRAMKKVFCLSGMRYAGKVVWGGTRNQNQVPKRIITKINYMIH
jgi:multimeric flavodoxin WrbA